MCDKYLISFIKTVVYLHDGLNIWAQSLRKHLKHYLTNSSGVLLSSPIAYRRVEMIEITVHSAALLAQTNKPSWVFSVFLLVRRTVIKIKVVESVVVILT